MRKFIEQIYQNNKEYKGIVFLDRDGTINNKGRYIYNTRQIKILPTVNEGIKILNKKNIAVVVITNQPVVANNYTTVSGLKKINDHLVNLLKKKGAYIDSIYSCPHHPNGEILKYRMKCKCRKPGTLMFKEALLRYNTPKILGIIGDQTKDVVIGKKLKMKTVVVKTGYMGQDGKYNVKPDFTCNNFLDSVKALARQ